jgi:hypothetical protein
MNTLTVGDGGYASNLARVDLTNNPVLTLVRDRTDGQDTFSLYLDNDDTTHFNDPEYRRIIVCRTTDEGAALILYDRLRDAIAALVVARADENTTPPTYRPHARTLATTRFGPALNRH